MSEKVTYANILAWAQKYDEVENWLGHLQQKKHSVYYLYAFCKYAGKNPTEILAEKARDPAANVIEKLLDKFVAQSTDFTNAQKYNIAISVKSFFKWNYRDLAKAAGKVDLQKVKDYNALTKEGLRKIWERALNPRDRAILPFVCSTAIAKETLSNLTWGMLEDRWEQKDYPCITIEPQFLKGHGRGKYAGVKQICFLTPEAKRELIIYRDWIEAKLGRKLTTEDHIWLETYAPYDPMSYSGSTHLIIRLSRNAGVPFTWHDARRYVNTALESVAISSNWARKIRGRKVRGEEAPYSRPAIEQLRAKFSEAVSLLEFTGLESTGAKEAARTAHIRYLVEEAKAAGASPEVCKQLEDDLLKEKVTTEEAAQKIEVLRTFKIKAIILPKEKLSKKEETKDCPDGEHSQKICSETELGPLLSEGWHVVTALPSGKIVIER